jgi:scyllo-inositol 2-dehydrogenase (NADP+)
VHYTTDLTEEVWFYLRGEEYSAQIDYFAQSVKQRRLDGENTFASALEADRVVAMLLGEAAMPAAGVPEPARKGFWSRIAG